MEEIYLNVLQHASKWRRWYDEVHVRGLAALCALCGFVDEVDDRKLECFVERNQDVLSGVLQDAPRLLRTGGARVVGAAKQLRIYFGGSAVQLAQSGAACTLALRRWLRTFAPEMRVACTGALARIHTFRVDHDPWWSGVSVQQLRTCITTVPSGTNAIRCPAAEHVHGLDNFVFIKTGEGDAIASVRIATVVRILVNAGALAPGLVCAELLLAPISRFGSVVTLQLQSVEAAEEENEENEEDGEPSEASEVSSEVAPAQQLETVHNVTPEPTSLIARLNTVPSLLHEDYVVLTVAADVASRRDGDDNLPLQIAVQTVVEDVRRLAPNMHGALERLRAMHTATLTQLIGTIFRRLCKNSGTSVVYGTLLPSRQRGLMGCPHALDALWKHVRAECLEPMRTNPGFEKVWFSTRQHRARARKRLTQQRCP